MDSVQSGIPPTAGMTKKTAGPWVKRATATKREKGFLHNSLKNSSQPLQTPLQAPPQTSLHPLQPAAQHLKGRAQSSPMDLHNTAAIM
mmetsp:Transcript_34396/g.83488  ORF Transcript_34396/g.83488 Transcript_34396/m.83488 type:complete len:88 (+) Transcript_34396:2187-2450(+)